VSSPTDIGKILFVDMLSVVLLMRVHALWEKDKRLGIFLAILAVVSISLGVVLLSKHPGVSEFIWIPGRRLTYFAGCYKICATP